MIGRTTKSALVRRNNFGALCIHLEMRRSGIYYDNIIWVFKYNIKLRHRIIYEKTEYNFKIEFKYTTHIIIYFFLFF